MDSASLAIPKPERDLYSAHEVVQFVPLFSRHHSCERLLKANAWVRTYLPHAYIPQRRLLTPTVPKQQGRLERVFRLLQLRYMEYRRTSEVITRHMLRFHPQDARNWVLKEYKERLREYRELV